MFGAEVVIVIAIVGLFCSGITWAALSKPPPDVPLNLKDKRLLDEVSLFLCFFVSLSFVLCLLVCDKPLI